MSIVFKSGDMFTSGSKYLCHQVNCMGKMGSGIAKTVREMFHTAYTEYVELCTSELNPEKLLGRVLQSDCGERSIIHMFAQYKFGRVKRYTDYKAFRNCLSDIKRIIPAGTTIAFPHGIGCGLGGGKWEVILPMIEEELSNDYEIEVWKYGV